MHVMCGAAAAVQRTHPHTLDPSHTHTMQEERRRHRLYVQNTAGYSFRGAWESQAKKKTTNKLKCIHGLPAADHPIRVNTIYEDPLSRDEMFKLKFFLASKVK